MPDYEHDVFISYAHVDNKPLSEEHKGWIAILDDALRTRLAQLLDDNPRIWRDKKLGGNDRFGDEIVDRLVSAATLVSVLSPRYVKSEWCTRELETFLTAAEHGKVDLGNKSRLFKVFKTPIKSEQEPPAARGLLGYPFYKEDDASGRWREFNQAFGKDIEPEFWRALDDLAQDISKLLGMLRSDPVETTARAIPKGATVYLAQTTSDLEDERNQIRRELEDGGHVVLPDRPLPHAGADLEAIITGYLERSRLSIHIVGANYGLVPEARDQSLLEIQNALATARSQAGDLNRLVWMPLNLEIDDKRQGAFIKALNNDPDLSTDDSVLETTLEELKTVIEDKLGTPSGGTRGSKPFDGLTRVYVIHDERDEAGGDTLDDFLYERGFEVMRPTFEGAEGEIQEDHERKLDHADAVLIYYDAADERWLNTKLFDLDKMAAGRSASAIYIGGTETKAKRRFRTREVGLVIKQFGALRPESLSEFVDQLTADEHRPE